MAAVNYATQYQQAVQQAYYGGLYFQAMYETANNNVLKWINAKTIQIPSLVVGGFIDVDRDVAGTFSRRADNNWETKTIEHDRELPLYVDPMDIDETNQVLSIANITRVFNSEQKIPEMDKYFASKAYSEFVSLGKTADTTVVDTDNILSVFDKLMKEMDEAEVPKEGRFLYVTPDFEEKLKNAQQIQRALDIRGTESKDVNRNIRSLDSVTLVSVPSARMKTAYNFTSGAVPATGADQINMILIHPTAVVTPQKYDYVGLSNPSPETHGKYYYYERKYWDVFILGQKVNGVKFHITEAGA